MYGYILPDKSTIKSEQFTLFSAFYCGLCKVIGKNFGQLSRFTTNYDTTFFAAFIFDQLNYPVDFNKEKCVGNPVRGKLIIKQNPLFIRIADINILLAYLKAEDNVYDKEFGAKSVKRFFKKRRDKSALREPEIAELLEKHYSALRELEEKCETNIDLVSDCFASMMRDSARVVLADKANEHNLGLIYNVGKFVYLADALDDVSEDYKKKRYNPFLAAFAQSGYQKRQTPGQVPEQLPCGNSPQAAEFDTGCRPKNAIANKHFYSLYKGRAEFIKDNYASLQFIFAATANRAIECFNCLAFNQSFSLLENIIYYGLRKKVDELLKSDKKLKKPKL